MRTSEQNTQLAAPIDHEHRPASPGIGLKRRRFLALGALAAAGSLAGCLGRTPGRNDPETQTLERSFAAPTVSDVRIENLVGDITVTGQGTGAVEVTVRKQADSQGGLDDLDVNIDLTDGTLAVETSLGENPLRFGESSPRADITLTVPEGATGPVVSDLRSQLGDITVLGTRGDTTVHTDLGDVTVSRVDGYLSLTSDLGTILASDVTGLETVTTALGDIKVDLFDIRGDVALGTELGSVVVGVADDLDLDVLAEATDGIDSNLPLRDSQAVGSRLTGRLNAGGRQLHAYSDLGDVSLRSIARPR